MHLIKVTLSFTLLRSLSHLSLRDKVVLSKNFKIK